MRSAADSTSMRNALSRPGACLSVPVDRLIEFDLGDLKKPDRQGRYLAMMSRKSLAASSPRR